MPACGRQNGQCLASCDVVVVSELAESLTNTFLLSLFADEETFDALQISVQIAVSPALTDKAEEIDGASVLSKIAKIAIQLVNIFLCHHFFMERIIAQQENVAIAKS